MKRISTILMLWAACLPLILSCNRALEVPDPEAGLPPFPKPSEQISNVPLTRAEEGFVQAGNEFAWRLTRKVWAQNTEKKSLILSPLSVQYALGMLGNGADETVAKQLADVLGYEGVNAINEFCAKLIECLPAVDTSVTLALANGVLVKKEYTLKAPFKNAVTNYYDALVESMSFGDPNAVMKYVNDWCYKHTYGRIKDVLKEVDPDAFMYLMNAIYFYSKWTKPFEKANTRNEDFHSLSGTAVKVGMMHQTLDTSYGENDACQSVSIPYGNRRFVLTVYLPKSEKGLAALLDQPQENLAKPYEYCHVILSLPGFRTDYEIDMKNLLAGMGLPLSPYNELVEKSKGAPEISKVIHKANITVNESGTEAAAVTVIEMRDFASAEPMPEPRTVTFTADHPFLYTITEATSGVILFTGAYTGQ